MFCSVAVQYCNFEGNSAIIQKPPPFVPKLSSCLSPSPSPSSSPLLPSLPVSLSLSYPAASSLLQVLEPHPSELSTTCFALRQWTTTTCLPRSTAEHTQTATPQITPPIWLKALPRPLWSPRPMRSTLSVSSSLPGQCSPLALLCEESWCSSKVKREQEC